MYSENPDGHLQKKKKDGDSVKEMKMRKKRRHGIKLCNF